MIVYIVTHNLHGERKIKAVFEDRDQAVYCCALCAQEDTELEQWDTEALKISGSMRPLAEWTVCVNNKGVVIDADVKYTFEKHCRYREDVDGSVVACLTQDMNVTEDEVKKIVLAHVAASKKSQNHEIT